MKRLFIAFFVALIHILVITLIYHGCHAVRDDSGTEDDDAGESGQVESEDRESGEESDLSETKEDFIVPTDFTAATASLPSEIKEKTKSCDSGILVDLDNRDIIWQKNSRQAVPIASMVKMMTALNMMRLLENDHSMSLKSRVDVTETAASIGGRQVYLDPRESFTLDELLKCIMIFSANDAAYLIAETLGEGDVSVFVEQMNKLADDMQLEKAGFISPHGLPGADANHDRASPLELACIAAALLEYPEVLKYSSTRLSYIRGDDSRFDEFQLLNTNKLVGKVEGVNGMKTGYTQAAGYGTTVTCERNDRTLIAVVTGCSSGAGRDELVTDLLEWQFGRQ